VNASSTTLESSAHSVPAARHFAASYVRSLGLGPDAVADTELVVSELVANAVEHGEGRIDLRLGLRGTELQIEVRDNGPGRPVPVPVPGPSGYGLRVVDRIATIWGVRPVTGGPGKTVWCRLPAEREGVLPRGARRRTRYAVV
jgi:anti-sigma regulatory factor (Ser/Thr protein kinase)